MSNIWLNYVVSPYAYVTTEINGKTIEQNTSRHGVVKSEPAFFRSDVTSIERIITLAHEARHTDCPRKPSPEVAYSLLRNSDEVDPSEWQCGNAHARCNPNEALRTCDGLAWGSYVVTRLMFIKIYKDCTSCSESEKQVANLTAQAHNRCFALINSPYEGTPVLSSFDDK